MLTQYQTKRQARTANKAIVLNIRPELRLKMKLHRTFQQQKVTQTHRNQVSGQSSMNYINKIMNKSTELWQQQQTSYELGCKRKIPRRLSSYQMYKEEQKQMKTGHYNKIMDWKNKFLLKSKPTIKRDSLRFLRTKSVSEYSGKNSRACMFRSIQSNQPLQFEEPSRSRVMTCERQVKQPVNINKIKIRLQLNLLSNTITRQSSQYQSLKPKISTISPSTKSNNIIKYNLLQAKQRQRMSNISQRGKDKIMTMRPFETKDCRPWSGVKGEAYIAGDMFIF